MAWFDARVTIEYDVTVEADSEDDALELVQKMFDDGDLHETDRTAEVIG